MKTFEVTTLETVKVVVKNVYVFTADNETTVEDAKELVEQGNVCRSMATTFEETESEPKIKVVKAHCVETWEAEKARLEELENEKYEKEDSKNGNVGRF